MEKTITYELKYPVGSKTKLTIRRPKARDYLAMESTEGNAVEKLLNLMSALTQEDPRFLEDLDGEDFFELEELIEGFLPQKLLAKIEASARKNAR
jgi:hypothetical protein